MRPSNPHDAAGTPRAPEGGVRAGARLDRAMGIAIVLVLATHAFVDKTSATRIEMLYLCHLSSALLALGLLARSARAVGGAFLALAVLGTPSWLIYAALTHDVGPSSVAVHLVPLALGAHVVLTRGLVRGSELVAMGLFLVALVIGVLVSTPRANLNLAFGPGPGMEWLVVPTHVWRVALTGAVLTLLLATAHLVRRYSR